MQGYAADLAQLGLGTVDAAWLRGDHDWDGSQGGLLEVAQRFALDDVRDLAAAQVVIVFSEEPSQDKVRAAILAELEDVDTIHTNAEAVADRVAAIAGRNRGGRHVEYGMALASKKYVVIVGPAENVFHSLPQVPRYATWTDAVAHLLELRERSEAAAIRARILQ
jgi:hypothetical protein